jgi:siroheme synthase-like protein
VKPFQRGLPITLDLEGARVLIIGEPTDDETVHKRALVQAAGARVEESPTFDAERVAGARLVMLLSRDRALAETVLAQAHRHGALAFSVDDPEHSDFAMPAIADLGPATIAVATSGASPALAARVKSALAEQLSDRFGQFVRALGETRARIQREESDVNARRKKLLALLDGFHLVVSATYPSWFR